MLDPRPLNLNEVLSTLHPMLARLLGEDVELKLSLTPGIGTVLADRGQIEQVVMNLVVNARDAMPHGGSLTVQTSSVDLDEGYAGEHVGVTAGSYVMMAVSDTGVGMDAATRSRVFEPFFTTKERGKGTGLGLATVFGIVKQSGGNIWVYSEPGMGATFRVYLPVTSGAPEKAISVPRAETLRGTETILLVEDEHQVRSLAISILERAGYRVLTAGSPAEAQEMLDGHPDRIDLLVTDVVMPGMNGRQLAERILARRPGLRVVFMSGYTDDVVLHHGVLDSEMAFIQKPLTPESLTRKVRQVLDAS